MLEIAYVCDGNMWSLALASCCLAAEVFVFPFFWVRIGLAWDAWTGGRRYVVGDVVDGGVEGGVEMKML